MNKTTDIKRTLAFANAANVLFYLFIILLALLHFLKPELNPLQRFISEYAVGKYGFIMMLAFFSLSLGSFLLLLAAAKIVWQRRKAVVLILLFVWCVCVFIAAVFPTDAAGMPETVQGHIHNNISMLGFICVIAAAFFAIGLFKKQIPDKYRRSQVLLAILMLTIFVVMLASVITDAGFTGLMQRLFIAVVIIWLVTTCNAIKRLSRTSV